MGGHETNLGTTVRMVGALWVKPWQSLRPGVSCNEMVQTDLTSAYVMLGR